MGHVRLKGNSVLRTGVQSQIQSILESIEPYSESNRQNQTVVEIDIQILYQKIVSLGKMLERTMHMLEKNELDQSGYRLDSLLTDRELEVIGYFHKGLSYKETAEILDCKISTIQTHAKRIYKKLGVHSRAEAVFELNNSDSLQG